MNFYVEAGLHPYCMCQHLYLRLGSDSPLSLLGDEITTVYVTWLHQIDRFRLFFPMERNEMTLQRVVLPSLRSYLPWNKIRSCESGAIHLVCLKKCSEQKQSTFLPLTREKLTLIRVFKSKNNMDR
jgi:hypothetical protein